jgi:hypothetical protein
LKSFLTYFETISISIITKGMGPLLENNYVVIVPVIASFSYLYVVNVVSAALSGNEEFFDEDFGKDFANLESGNKFYSKIEDGFRNWEER